MKIHFETPIDRDLKTVVRGFNRDLFLSLKPPGVSIDLQRFDGCKAGDEIHILLKQPGFTSQWISHITQDQQTEKQWFFVDEGKVLPWPLKAWKHLHKVEYLSENSCLIVDDIDFKCASRALEWLVYPVLWSTFAIRPKLYQKFFKDFQ